MAGRKVSPLSLSQFRSFTITVLKVLLFIFLAHLVKTTLSTQNSIPFTTWIVVPASRSPQAEERGALTTVPSFLDEQ